MIHKGQRGISGRIQCLTLTSRLALALAFMSAVGMLPHWLALQGTAGLALQLGSLLVGATLVLAWFHQSFGAAIGAASGLDLSARTESQASSL